MMAWIWEFGGERVNFNNVIKTSATVEVTNLQSRQCFREPNIGTDLNATRKDII